MLKGKCIKYIQSEKHAFFILFISVIAIAWWVSIWGLMEGYIDWLENNYKVKRVIIYLYLFAAVMLIIFLFPELLDKV